VSQLKENLDCAALHQDYLCFFNPRVALMQRNQGFHPLRVILNQDFATLQQDSLLIFSRFKDYRIVKTRQCMIKSGTFSNAYPGHVEIFVSNGFAKDVLPKNQILASLARI
jgi:hypothetical protein